MLDEVRSRFEVYPNVFVIPGYVPEVLDELDIDKIAFLHIDLNNVEGEIGR